MAHILPFRLLIIDPITELRESLALNMQIKNSPARSAGNKGNRSSFKKSTNHNTG